MIHKAHGVAQLVKTPIMADKTTQTIEIKAFYRPKKLQQPIQQGKIARFFDVSLEKTGFKMRVCMENSTQHHVDQEEYLLDKIEFEFSDVSEIKTAPIALKQLIIAGWAGRDPATNLHHIEELKAIGVKPPRNTPMFYRLGHELLSSRAAIQVAGDHSSGEAEAILVQTGGQRWVGVGSDHTDRKVEAYGVTVSKQMCPKPISRQLWRYDDVSAHWDQLVLRSYTGDGQDMHLYQEGCLDTLLHPEQLIKLLHDQGGRMDDGSVMFCGTVAAKGGIRAARTFRVELHDPVLGRTLAHQYNTVALPIAD